MDRQEFRLRPDPKVNEAIKYLAMVIGKRYGLSMHCITALSNHLHSVMTDWKGAYPEFLRDFHQLVTKCVNFIFNESGDLWDSRQTNRLFLEDAESIKKEIGYTMANPTAAGLVENGEEWPGVRACWPVEEEVVRRPAYFSSKGSPVRQAKGLRHRRPTVQEVDAMQGIWEAEGVKYPEYVVFRLARPPGFEGKEEAVIKEIETVIENAEEGAREERRKAGKRGYLGKEGVLALPRWSRSQKLHKRYSFVPKVVARNQKTRRAAWKHLKWWSEAYDDSFAAWPTNPNVEFPIGTYQHCVYHGANVSATAPPGL